MYSVEAEALKLQSDTISLSGWIANGTVQLSGGL